MVQKCAPIVVEAPDHNRVVAGPNGQSRHILKACCDRGCDVQVVDSTDLIPEVVVLAICQVAAIAVAGGHRVARQARSSRW